MTEEKTVMATISCNETNIQVSFGLTKMISILRVNKKKLKRETGSLM